jgi:hypothetical protein
MGKSVDLNLLEMTAFLRRRANTPFIHPAKADKRTRSKWSRALRYAVAHKPVSEALDQFIRRMGGINACAARFSRP